MTSRLQLLQTDPSLVAAAQTKPQKPNPLPCTEGIQGQLGRFPNWLHRKLPSGSQAFDTHELLHAKRLHTVCEQARCPNITECYSKKTATFLAMGKQCTRQCGFCSIEHAASPQPLDPDEPEQIVQAAKQLGLRHVVITQVARDDLVDGGAHHLARIIGHLRAAIDTVTIEVLTSDFEGRLESLRLVMDQEPEVFNHNLETVARLSSRVRHKAQYKQSLHILSEAKAIAKGKTRFIKSGLMVGLGESDEEVKSTLIDLKKSGVDIVTIGQYLQSSRSGLLVRRFVPPETFEIYRDWGLQLGISYMYCAPFVRSSYNASLFVEGSS